MGNETQGPCGGDGWKREVPWFSHDGDSGIVSIDTVVEVECRKSVVCGNSRAAGESLILFRYTPRCRCAPQDDDETGTKSYATTVQGSFCTREGSRLMRA
jgi:hypothetical protein